MDYQVIWSPEALEDINEIATFIHKDSPHYAQAVVEHLINASRTLHQFPLRGRKVPELEDERYRERFVYNYRMIYHLEGQIVKIVAVIHGNRLLENTGHSELEQQDE